MKTEALEANIMRVSVVDWFLAVTESAGFDHVGLYKAALRRAA